MCGIWASVGLLPPREVIERVAHRGPDGEGWRELESAAGPVVLAHRRLAVIDTSAAGLQPMADAEERLWITFNGEIYNYRELRDELAGRGHRFRTRTDTEVLLAAWREWGEAALPRLNGMFAFVLFDARRAELVAVRDRFGVKPLYLARVAGGLALASEIKQLLALPELAARLDPERALDFLAGGLLDHTERTLFAGIGQLRGGAMLRVALADPGGLATPQRRRWYRFPEAPRPAEADEAAEGFAALLDDSVRLRLRADVTVGSCLSGGLDSSSIVCLVARHTHRLATFSAVHDDPAIDERRFIREVVAVTGAEGHETTPRGAELAASAERLAWMQDEPFGSTSVFAQDRVFALARQHRTKVMLDGQGADEQLGGYAYCFGAFHAGLLRHGRLVRLAAELAAQRRRHGIAAAAQLRALAAASLPDAIRGPLARVGRRPPWILPAFWREHRGGGGPAGGASLAALSRAQLLATSLPMLLHYEDRNSMAHGIEARLPFLDYRVVEWSLAQGDEHKIVDGETKWMLRRAMSAMLPPAIRDRQDKLGFPTPELEWLRGPLRPVVADGLDQLAKRLPALFVGGAAPRFAEDVLAGRRPFDFALWRLVGFGLWSRVFGVSL